MIENNRYAVVGDDLNLQINNGLAQFSVFP